MAQKNSRRLVAMATAAVTAIYMTGYLATAGASASMDPSPVVATLQGTAAVVAATTSTPTVVAVATVAPTAAAVNPSSTRTSAAPSPTTAAPSATAAAATTAAYRDGTYTGTGNSRRGGFDVAVTISGGRITTAQITRAFTEYPASRVSALPGQVVARQSANVDKVTGATYSSQAFQQAVQAALAQAAA